ncbi:hypothetical protein NGTWS0302_32560 [Mycolicibacterium cyprinidarum]|uniref:DUF1214 domain-containing protein n=1 Tax=Mycolicibacterium cyprinidarum TaxID=2860311 RepID=A0ABQ4VCN7_9MYCO|nr:hypothetical protein NGTWS0302_32560 [Mycolicibacterium sp. NGTWS0302]GJF20097.1 hypothetical protein NGTWS1702_29100 [Mycolicibacterium sp. NGTWSNA01]
MASEAPDDEPDTATALDEASTPQSADSGRGTPQQTVAPEEQPGDPVAPIAKQTSLVEVPAVGSISESDSDDPQAPVTSPVELALAAHTRRQADHDVTAGVQAAAPQGNAGIAADAMSNQVSPLGTQEQIARERIAIQTSQSLPVAVMKVLLRWGFLAAAKEQFALVGGPDEANRAALDNAVDEYALAAAFQQQILNPLDPAVVTQVAPPHSWYGLDVGGSRLLYDNPDTIYRFIPVNKTSQYVLTGRIYEGIPADTTFSVLEGLAGTTSTILSLQDLDISEDGTFVITVSGEPAAPGQTNYLQLTSRSTLIAARNTLGDWDIEEPMELAVHRVAGPRNSLFAQLGGFVFLGPLVNDSPFLTSLVSIIPPLAIADTSLVRGPLAATILFVRGANEEAKYMALATTDPDTGELRPPNVMTQPASNAEFLANQLQSNGYFQLNDDEALVLTIEPGNAGFFTVPVYNDWTITDDYWNEQTSLNNDQAVANPDGTYTMVVSLADPAVANWISTGGLNQGIISMRFQNLDPDSMDAPGVQSVVVKLEDLDDHLPAGTVYVTPAERAVQLAQRKAGFDKRWAPYLQA